MDRNGPEFRVEKPKFTDRIRGMLMWKHIRRILMIFLAVVMLFCGSTIAVVQHQYNVAKRLYRAASTEFTAPTAGRTSQEKKKLEDDGIERLEIDAPIKVDFAKLLEVNPDVVGWIYCPDTVIDYPVVHGADNDLYLHHSYDRTYNASGSIFVDARNLRDFSGPDSILYGHHMASGSMFAGLSNWQVQEYFEKHPVMWLLTPTQDYRVDLFSAYNTSAYSDSYTFFYEWGPEFTDYLNRVESYSGIHIDKPLDPYGKYVMLSTCAYMFEDARSVLHGWLRPVMSAGGIPFE